ncbi:MAG: HAMP domain-containing histidine kinase, partial [Saprospiraceae bacterium]|nr:HAMP domain-containing histidine kinase [Saprospiraceae bacterium]
IKWLTIFGVFAIISIFLVQIFWVRQAFTISESQFDQSVNGALRRVAENIAISNKTDFQQNNPVIKINPRHYIVNVNSEIDAELLDHYLVAALDYFHIDQDVEYSIYSCFDKTMVYCNYIQKKKPQKEYTTPVLPKFEGVDYYFSVSFPHYPIVSLNNIPMWMITSAVLILVILFFIFSLFVVFAQKSVTQVQRDFINNMTHEFKTPISTISVIQQVISDPDIVKTPQRLATYTQIIGAEIGRLNDQVEKVLNITRLEKKHFDLHLEEIDVHEIISQVVFNVQNTDFEKNITITQELNAQHHTIAADKVHFTNVINNIVENAAKYSSDEPKINISTRNSNHKLMISISDKGEGIDKKNIKKIFEKFYRVPKGAVHNVKGFGLGLYYVKIVSDAHKWNLTVTSIPNEGTVFTIQVNTLS